MKHCIISNGFECDFDVQNANDMRVLVRIKDLIDPDASPLAKTSALVDLPVMLLGKEQTDKLYEHLAALHDGRVPPAEVEKALTEIMTASETGKK